jgi:hypothetical protein
VQRRRRVRGNEHRDSWFWHGGGWTSEPIATASDGVADLASVSCTAADACTAVGTVDRSFPLPFPFGITLSAGAGVPLAERYS